MFLCLFFVGGFWFVFDGYFVQMKKNQFLFLLSVFTMQFNTKAEPYLEFIITTIYSLSFYWQKAARNL